MAALLLSICSAAAEDLAVCFNYGCTAQAQVSLSDSQLEQVASLFGGVQTAEGERMAIAQAIGWLYHYAGYQTPIWRDKGGNINDDYYNGRMDCIDHSTNTTRFLHLLERRGMLNHHAVREPVKRGFLVSIHMAAQIAELATSAPIAPAGTTAEERKFAVDSWFFDPGYPAEIYPLGDWLRGRRPRRG